jgi:hypothetical protein
MLLFESSVSVDRAIAAPKEFRWLSRTKADCNLSWKFDPKAMARHFPMPALQLVRARMAVAGGITDGAARANQAQ